MGKMKKDATLPKKPDRLVADGRTWKRVKAPKPWHPKEEGDTLVGAYLGMQEKNGKYGPYKVVLIKTEEEVYRLNGTVILSLFEGAGFQVGEMPTVRLVFLGLRDGSHDNPYKDFDLYIADNTVPLSSKAKSR